MNSLKLLFAFLMVLVSVAQVHAGEPLPILSSEWPPYASEDKEHPGFFLEVVNEAFRLSGYDIKVSFATWARCIKSVEYGDCFASFPFTKTSEREHYALFSEPVFLARTPVVFNRKLKPDFDYTGADCLKGVKLGGVVGWFYLEQWKDYGLPYYTLHNQNLAFKMIDAGRIDHTVFDEFAAKYYLRQHPELMDTISFSKTPYSEEFSCLMISKKYPHGAKILREFNENLQKLKENGFLDTIARKYDVPVELFVP